MSSFNEFVAASQDLNTQTHKVQKEMAPMSLPHINKQIYKSVKKLGIYHTQYALLKLEPCFEKWLQFLADHSKKQDDLTDCFLQNIYVAYSKFI
jgi:hypothetical protein